MNGSVRSKSVLQGSICSTVALAGTISSEEVLVGSVAIPSTISGGDCEDYVGSYTATPKLTEQVLPTAGKRLVKDILIREIPYYDVSNSSGGSTIYIGNEV